jgi:glycosyltransferase involved in cell wall biosynthesis
MSVAVLHVCDKFGVRGSSIHGVSRLFSWWFPRYDPARFEVSLCGLKREEPATRWLGEQGIPVHHLGRGRFDPRIVADVTALARRLGTRILHVHGYAAADFGRIAARLAGCRLVLHEHFADPRMPAYQGLADRLLAPLTDAAIAVSRSTREFLVARRHVPAGRVRLIWNGAPLDEFAPVARERALRVRRELGVADDARLVGTIGRLNAQKGHRYLLDAAARVAGRLPDTRFVIAGDGDLLDELRRQARDLGIGARVVFAGHRTDVPDLLGALDVFCLSSLYEGTPLALFEAMAAGKAIVSTNVDGCREVLEDEASGVLVPAADPVALAEALERLLSSDEERKALASRALEASRRYDVRACVDQMQQLYDELLSGAQGAGSR